MTSHFILTRLILLFMVVPLFAASPLRAQEHLIICGTGDSQHLLRRLARTFEERNPGITVAVPDSIGSSGGVKATAGGQCDLGRVARPLREKEKKYHLDYRLFAYSPVVFLANANLKGKVKGVTASEVIAIFRGEISQWDELGGPPEKIYVANREPGDSSRTVLEEHLPGFAGINEPVGKTIYTTPETIDTIAAYANTIGYSSLSAARHRDDIIILDFEGVSPSPGNVLSGAYGLTAPFGLVWTPPLSPPAHRFLDFLEQGAARAIISNFGAVPVLSGE